jgi:hypothetical protein
MSKDRWSTAYITEGKYLSKIKSETTNDDDDPIRTPARVQMELDEIMLLKENYDKNN